MSKDLRDLIDTKAELKLAKVVTEAVLISSFENGHLTFEELMNTNPLRKLADMFKGGPKGEDPDVDMVIDHRETILKDARKFASNGKHKYAQVFYALYFEHEVNALVTQLMIRKEFSRKTILAITKHSLSDKLTWIMEILGVNPPRKEFLNFIKPLSDDRNAFIHYKWLGKNINADPDKKPDYAAIDRQVTYFKSYASNIIYSGKKGVVLKRISELTKSREPSTKQVLPKRK